MFAADCTHGILCVHCFLRKNFFQLMEDSNKSFKQLKVYHAQLKIIRMAFQFLRESIKCATIIAVLHFIIMWSEVLHAQQIEHLGHVWPLPAFMQAIECISSKCPTI